METSKEELRGTFKLPEGQICMEKNCKEPATVDYNGFGHWVCAYHDRKLNEYFEEEYS